MRVSIRAGAAALLLGSSAFAGGMPHWMPMHGHHAAADCPGCNEASPLSPQLAWWVLQPSYCKMPFCTRARPHHWGEGETPYFPPLPYSHRALNYGGPTMTSAPVEGAVISSPAPGAVMPGTPPAVLGPH